MYGSFYECIVKSTPYMNRFPVDYIPKYYGVVMVSAAHLANGTRPDISYDVLIATCCLSVREFSWETHSLHRHGRRHKEFLQALCDRYQDWKRGGQDSMSCVCVCVCVVVCCVGMCNDVMCNVDRLSSPLPPRRRSCVRE
jgi:hypothetical protein